MIFLICRLDSTPLELNCGELYCPVCETTKNLYEVNFAFYTVAQENLERIRINAQSESHNLQSVGKV
jgi:uncharacterized Zn finger protein (UPF0148 family)